MGSMLVLPPDLVEAVPREGYTVHLRFADGLADPKLAEELRIAQRLEHPTVLEQVGEIDASALPGVR